MEKRIELEKRGRKPAEVSARDACPASHPRVPPVEILKRRPRATFLGSCSSSSAAVFCVYVRVVGDDRDCTRRAASVNATSCYRHLFPVGVFTTFGGVLKTHSHIPPCGARVSRRHGWRAPHAKRITSPPGERRSRERRTSGPAAGEREFGSGAVPRVKVRRELVGGPPSSRERKSVRRTLPRRVRQCACAAASDRSRASRLGRS